MNTIKLFLILLVSMFIFSGCGPKTGIEQFLGNIDRLSVCGECLDVVQDIQETKTLQEINLNNILDKMQRLQ